MMSQSSRFAAREKRPINRDTFISEWPEAGLIIVGSPNDPSPSIAIGNGRITEMDGRNEAEFDLIDRFIASRAIDIDVARTAMSTDSLELARMTVDMNVSRVEVARLIAGCSPAKLVEVLSRLNVVEMMMALQKMRLRRSPANQAHVTNRKETPALLAADAAEAALRGFAEVETTVGVSRYAPLNAIAVLVGSQTGRGGVLTQCSVEEELGLRIALKGFTSYAETLSVYGTERTFVDGDDTPWSKAFLASAYASRGVKIRFTSGSGSEALMAHSEGKSMLYLEARSLLIAKASGSQGVQNGSISLIALVMSLPRGLWGVLAENLLAAMLGLELASGNDALSSHSDIRKGAKLMLQFLPGTDLITSGYSLIPKIDNMFGGGNFDSDDLDDWYALQRDMIVDGGIRPVREDEVLAVREEAARAIQAVFRQLDLPAITDDEVERAVTAYDSDDMPDRDRGADVIAADALMAGESSAIDVIKALSSSGFHESSQRVLEMQRQRITGDYLQPSAIFDEEFAVRSVLNDPNDYAGPGTGYRVLDEQRWPAIQDLPFVRNPRDLVPPSREAPLFIEQRNALAGSGTEVVIAVGPAFGSELQATISGWPHRDVITALINGIEEAGVAARIVKVYHSADCAFIGHAAAKLSGCGIGIGIQSKGTTVIHSKRLAPLNNLELFSMAPSLSLESYRAIGHNAASYALGRPVAPVPITIDNTARLRLIVRTTVMHLIETGRIQESKAPVEIEVRKV